MNKESFFISLPVSFDKDILIYPPSVKDVIENKDFGTYLKILTLSQEEIEDLFAEEKGPQASYPTPIEFLMNNCYHNREYNKLAKEAFTFFIHQEVSFLYEQKMIAIGNLKDFLLSGKKVEELPRISEDTFFDFQNLIRESCGSKKVEKPNPNEHPKIREMKRKARYRDRIKVKSGRGISLLTSLVSICCMGLGITPLNVGEMSYVALSSIISKYQDKEKYDLDINTLLAGGDSKKIKPEYWIKNFDD